MTYNVVVIFSIFLFIAVAMLATIWGYGAIMAWGFSLRGEWRLPPPCSWVE
jgi:hypothetical protein